MNKNIIRKNKNYIFLFVLLTTLFLSSCSRRLGYGVLLWSAEEPPIPSGTVLPVFIRSNINQVWVAGIPREFRNEGTRIDKFEIPLSQLELAGSRRRAQARAEDFASYALLYAETLQDGLPIRERPDNTSRRVYRLRQGEIIKILAGVSGTVAIGATGAPLSGEWFRVLTEDGTLGYCFSYRLTIFEHREGPLAAVRTEQQQAEDPILDRILARAWSPESYRTMINNQRINLDELSQKWHFDPGQDTGTARIFTSDLDITFPYTRIRSTGTQSWRFEGTQLQMNLRAENTLAVQFTENNGLLRSLIFVTLPSSVDDIILQETIRRESQFRNIYDHGPSFISNNYGTLTFMEDGNFIWTGSSLLVPQIIPASALGSGTASMRLFISNAMGERYDGAFSLYFDGIGAARARADFLYALDSQGLRIEHAPQTSMDGMTVVRRASSPLVIFFFRSERPEEEPDFLSDFMY
jgi:hypothetical protein